MGSWCIAMSDFKELFISDRYSCWSAFCEENGYTFVKGSFFKSDKVRATFRNWTITMDTYKTYRRYGSRTHTRIRVLFINTGDFRFSIYRSTILTRFAERLGFRDIKTGDEQFDEAFVLKANDADKMKSLMDSPLRGLIAQQPEFYLTVFDEVDLTTILPDNMLVLHFSVKELILDTERLKSLFNIFTTILDRLCDLGLAETASSNTEKLI